MGLLNGKAKELFLKYAETTSYYTKYSNHTIKYENSERGEFLWYGNETDLFQEPKFLNALIIEWLDSFGYRIGIEPYYDQSGTFRANFGGYGFQSNDRHQATTEAIKKAVELINESNGK